MKTHCLEVRGDFACFTRSDMKVGRVSYNLKESGSTVALCFLDALEAAIE